MDGANEVSTYYQGVSSTYHTHCIVIRLSAKKEEQTHLKKVTMLNLYKKKKKHLVHCLNISYLATPPS